MNTEINEVKNIFSRLRKRKIPLLWQLEEELLITSDEVYWSPLHHLLVDHLHNKMIPLEDDDESIITLLIDTFGGTIEEAINEFKIEYDTLIRYNRSMPIKSEIGVSITITKDLLQWPISGCFGIDVDQDKLYDTIKQVMYVYDNGLLHGNAFLNNRSVTDFVRELAVPRNELIKLSLLRDTPKDEFIEE